MMNGRPAFGATMTTANGGSQTGGQPQVMEMADVRAYVHILMDGHGYTAQEACDAVGTNSEPR